MRKQNLVRKLQIGVIGSAGSEEYPVEGGATKKLINKARKIGFLLAEKDVFVVTGGKGGIMEAAAKGTKEGGGITIGVVKDGKRFVSNDFTDVEVVTGMSTGGSEFIQALMCDALVVMGGGAGTLEEIAIAYRNNKPIVVLDNTEGWSEKIAGRYLDQRKQIKIAVAKTPKEAVEKAIQSAKKNLTHN